MRNQQSAPHSHLPWLLREISLGAEYQYVQEMSGSDPRQGAINV
jgi:hypothetical protein